MSDHRAGTARHATHRAPLSLGRLAVWLLFWFMIACLFLGFVVTLVKGEA